MSKKKHREKNKEGNQQGGINPQILDMLRGSNLDFGKVSSLISAMNQDGFDINSISAMMQGNQKNNNMNIGNQNNNMDFGNFDLGNIKNTLNNMDQNNCNFDTYGHFQNNNEINDENIEMLLIVKSVVNPKKARFLDKVIEMYKQGEIIY
ncbi:hypothetical protein [uncultured Clostridium sp.]|uniref:hypothetical protein n=1 Tax=uncultured Clostridium sp. TaxID=59620 RepID=UPI00262D0B12|nr:hypothetical protein [uncultured Clostridium sp.]